jgi:mono/diheme cytochrome c family protein
MKGASARIPGAALLGLALLSLPSCLGLEKSVGKDKQVTEGPAAVQFYGSGQAAYQNTVYKLARANCASCHASSQSPIFAASKIDVAYKAMTDSRKVDFVDIPGSSLLSKSGRLADNHCGGYCNGSHLAEWHAAIDAWWKGGECLSTNSCGPANGGNKPGQDPIPGGGAPPTGRVVTAAVTVPANVPVSLPNNANPQTIKLTYQLEPVNRDLVRAVFTVDITHVASQGYYLLSKPTVTIPAGSNYSMTVYDIAIVLNGTTDPNATTYRSIDTIVAPPGGVSMSASPLVLTTQRGPGADQIAIAFTELVRSTGLCKNLNGFRTGTGSVKALMLANCVSCHGDQGVFRINAADSDDALCSRALARSNPADASNSPLVLLPQGGVNRQGGRHPIVQGFNAAARTTFINWINSER